MQIKRYKIAQRQNKTDRNCKKSSRGDSGEAGDDSREGQSDCEWKSFRAGKVADGARSEKQQTDHGDSH